MLSIPHLIIIFVVALIVLGPEKLPEVARTLTKAMTEFRSVTSGMKETLEREMQDLEREITESKGASPQPAPSESHPALNAAEDASQTQEASAEEPPDPTDTGEPTATVEESFPAEATEVAPREVPEAPQEPEENPRRAVDDTPGKPTDEHTTAV